MQLLFWPSLELCKRCTLMKNGGVQVGVAKWNDKVLSDVGSSPDHKGLLQQWNRKLYIYCWRKPLWPNCPVQIVLLSATFNHSVEAHFLTIPARSTESLRHSSGPVKSPWFDCLGYEFGLGLSLSNSVPLEVVSILLSKSVDLSAFITTLRFILYCNNN